ncbi:MAG: hypothetical protein Q4C96_11030 [Planctomycetia bacterium]|nr:hypothetical protein [Planctomycetia bacterium]
MNNYLQFVACGTFSGITSFEENGENLHFVRLDYFGGKVSLPVVSEELRRFERMRIGSDCRFYGIVQPTVNGTVKIKTVQVVCSDEEGYKEPTVEEKYRGCIFGGDVLIQSKRSYVRSTDGENVYTLDVICYGGPLSVTCTEEVFRNLKKGDLLKVSGILISYTVSESRNGSRQTTLKTVPQITAFEPVVFAESKGRGRA